MSQHTPGPWHTRDRNWRDEPAGNRIYITGNHCVGFDMNDDDTELVEVPSCTAVAVVEGNSTSKEVTEANARLIAAAPELLAVAEGAIEFIRNGIELGYIRMPDLDTPDRAHEMLPSLEAAIAKARGAQ